jgi:hypothetical protein
MFSFKPTRSDSRLSIAAAPYEVTLKNGKHRLYSGLMEICRGVSMSSVSAVFDRHKKSFLDLEALFNHRRRKFISSPAN